MNENELPRPKQPGLRPQSLQLEPSPLKLREKMRLKRNTPKLKVAWTFAVPSPPETAKSTCGAKAANATGLTRTGRHTVPNTTPRKCPTSMPVKMMMMMIEMMATICSNNDQPRSVILVYH